MHITFGFFFGCNILVLASFDFDSGVLKVSRIGGGGVSCLALMMIKMCILCGMLKYTGGGVSLVGFHFEERDLVELECKRALSSKFMFPV